MLRNLLARAVKIGLRNPLRVRRQKIQGDGILAHETAGTLKESVLSLAINLPLTLCYVD